MNLTFTGGKELLRTLRLLPEAVRKRVMVGAMLAGGGIIQADASLRAPRDIEPRRRRGKRLADSIRTVVTRQTPSSVTVNVMTRDPVAHLVEFGHQNVPRGPSRQRVSITSVSKTGRISTKFAPDPTVKRPRNTSAASGFTPPKPFMRPAFDNNKEAALRKIGEVLGVGIETEARQLAGANHPSRIDHSAASWASGGGVTGGA